MKLTVEIETHDNLLVFGMFETHQSTIGMEKELAKDLKVRYERDYVRKALGLPEIVTLGIEIGSMIAAQLAASWLYDKLKGRATKLIIERTEVQVEKGEITRIIQDKFEKS